MAYDARLAMRVRRVLARRADIEEKAMFGGLAFMARGYMCCGIVQSKLMVRIDPGAYDRVLGEPHVQPMDFTGKPMRGFIYINPSGIASAPALRRWIARAVAFAESRPPRSRSGAGPRAGTQKRRGRAAARPRSAKPRGRRG